MHAQMVNEFVGEVFGGRPQTLYRKIAVKFLMARKWDMGRAKELYSAYRVCLKPISCRYVTDAGAGEGDISRSAPNRPV